MISGYSAFSQQEENKNKEKEAEEPKIFAIIQNPEFPGNEKSNCLLLFCIFIIFKVSYS